MSYTIWDEAHDRFCAAQEELNVRQGGWVQDTAEERAVTDSIYEEMEALDREVKFYEAHPEIGGLSTRDSDELKASKAASTAYLEATASSGLLLR